MDVMKSKVKCDNCHKETVHYKHDEGPWYYQVCGICKKRALLEGSVWEEFNNNRVDDIKERSGLEGN